MHSGQISIEQATKAGTTKAIAGIPSHFCKISLHRFQTEREFLVKAPFLTGIPVKRTNPD